MKPRVIVHPILIGLYPVLFAYAHNIALAPPLGEIIMLLALSSCLAAILWGALTLATGDSRKAAIGVSLFIVMFFSYGHLTNLLVIPLWNFRVLSISIGHIKVLACVWVIVGLTAGRWLQKASPDAIATATLVLNRTGAALVLLGTLSLGTTSYASGHEHTRGRRQRPADAVAASAIQTPAPDRALPDIYYIILDDYARPDILKEFYHYDDTGFMDSLRAKGFYIADRSHSNYSQTMLSLASSLNSSYLEAPGLMSAASSRAASSQHLAFTLTAAQYLNTSFGNARLPLAHMIQDNDTVRTLKEHRYRFVAFTSGYGGVQMPTADVVMQAHVFDDFEESLLSTTPIPDVVERLYDPLERHRERVTYVFDHLADRLGEGTPLFVFAHILCPHLPFAFKADGTPVQVDASKPQVIFDDTLTGVGEANRDALVAAYREQVQFVNRRIESVVEAILARPGRRPIIILQSDHGSQMTLDASKPSAAGIRERMSILNAYYVPGEIRTQLYPEISPVNTFRIILGQYFAGVGGLLRDESYLSTWESPYEFVPVTQLLHAADRAVSDQPESRPRLAELIDPEQRQRPAESRTVKTWSTALCQTTTGSPAARKAREGTPLPCHSAQNGPSPASQSGRGRQQPSLPHHL